jgi:O-antigen/teichoic acid export membrane protein
VETTRQSTIARIALRGTVWVSIGNYAYQLIGFFCLIYLRRLLPPDVFGFFDLAIFWVALLGVRNKIGLHYAALRHEQVNGAWLGTVLLIDLVAGVTGFIIMMVAVQPLATHFGYTNEFIFAMAVLALVDLISVAGNVFGIALEKDLQLSRNTLGTLISFGLSYAAAIVLALAGFQLTSLLSIPLVATCVGVAAGIYFCWRRIPHVFSNQWHIDRTLARAMIRDGLTTGLTLTLLYTIVSQFDNFLNATFVSPTMQGYYGNAFKIANWPSLLLATVIVRVGYNVMTRVKDDLPRLTHTVRLSLWLLCMLGIPLALVIGLGAVDLIEVLYPGGKWSESAQFLPPLAATSLANMFMTVGYWLSVAQGKRRFTVTLSIVQAALLMGAGLILVQTYGVNGTIVAVALASVCGFGLSQWFIYRNVDLRIREVFLAPLLASITSFAFYQFLLSPNFANLLHDATPFVRLLSGSLLIFGTYGAIIALTQRRNSTNNIRYLLKTWRGRQAA